MSLEKGSKYRYGFDEDGVIEVSRIITILEDGIFLTSYQEGYQIKPGADYSKEDARTIDIAQKLHTPEVVAAYGAKIAEIEAENVAEK